MTNPATFSLDSFKGSIGTDGVAWTDRYEVSITAPTCITSADASFDASTLASIRADHVNFPPMTINNKRLQIYGTSEPRPMSIDYGGEGLSITFLLDKGMKIKNMFDYWMQCIVDVDNALVGYQDDYICTLEIRQLDKTDNITYAVQIIDAYPFAQMPIDKNNSAQNSTDRLTVGFSYRKWANMGLPDFGTNASQPLLNQQVAVNTFAANNGVSPNDKVATTGTDYTLGNPMGDQGGTG